MRWLLALIFSISLLTAGDLSNRRAPGFSLQDIHQTQHDPQDYRGKVLVHDLMSTTCPHCLKISSILEEAKSKYKDKIAVLSLVTQPDTVQAVQKYIADHKITSPILFDCGQVMASYLKPNPLHPTVNFPHAFLIDANGIIKNDFEYGEATAAFFEGRGLFAELDKMVK